MYNANVTLGGSTLLLDSCHVTIRNISLSVTADSSRVLAPGRLPEPGANHGQPACRPAGAGANPKLLGRIS